MKPLLALPASRSSAYRSHRRFYQKRICKKRSSAHGIASGGLLRLRPDPLPKHPIALLHHSLLRPNSPQDLFRLFSFSSEFHPLDIHSRRLHPRHFTHRPPTPTDPPPGSEPDCNTDSTTEQAPASPRRSKLGGIPIAPSFAPDLSSKTDGNGADHSKCAPEQAWRID